MENLEQKIVEAVHVLSDDDTEFKYKIADVGFCNEATDEQKKKIRDKVNSSKIIYKTFENLRMEDIKNLPLEKAKVDIESQENKKELKTVETKGSSN